MTTFMAFVQIVITLIDLSLRIRGKRRQEDECGQQNQG